MLQIGLGTYGTFLENAAASGLGHPAIKWLLDAVSVDRWPEIVGVGVEPIPEHVWQETEVVLEAISESDDEPSKIPLSHA